MLRTVTIFMMCVKLVTATLVGTCNQCLADNKIVCLDETHFATCFRGSPTATITKCPDNRFCTDDVLICHTAAEGYQPICYHSDYCGECQITNGAFTCLNETTYGYCFGGRIPLESSLRSCPPGYVCNYNFRQVCVPEATNEPSCGPKDTNTTEINTRPTESITEDTTLMTTTMDPNLDDQTTTEISSEIATETTTAASTTLTTTEIITTLTQEIDSTTQNSTEMESTTSKTEESRDANMICKAIGNTGYFQADDPTCRQYVYCYILSGQYLGWFYYCDGYFNAVSQKCQNEKPPNCILLY